MEYFSLGGYQDVLGAFVLCSSNLGERYLAVEQVYLLQNLLNMPKCTLDLLEKMPGRIFKII